MGSVKERGTGNTAMKRTESGRNGGRGKGGGGGEREGGVEPDGGGEWEGNLLKGTLAEEWEFFKVDAHACQCVLAILRQRVPD